MVETQQLVFVIILIFTTVQTGLNGRAVAYTGDPVEFTGSERGVSSEAFHGAPDAAACFHNTATGGHFYSSNSEVNAGGVGVIEIDASGEVVGYFRTLSGTSRNCGGGKTPWYV
jgi:secreted PhoX family phosphatase